MSLLSTAAPVHSVSIGVDSSVERGSALCAENLVLIRVGLLVEGSYNRASGQVVASFLQPLVCCLPQASSDQRHMIMLYIPGIDLPVISYEAPLVVYEVLMHDVIPDIDLVLQDLLNQALRELLAFYRFNPVIIKEPSDLCQVIAVCTKFENLLNPGSLFRMRDVLSLFVYRIAVGSLQCWTGIPAEYFLM